MPPKTRGGKISKASKENIDVKPKSKLKSAGKVSKPPRKALADKTNSASDDNASILPTKTLKKVLEQDDLLVKRRPRRDRRLPNRYVECNALQNLSNSKNATTENEPSKGASVKIPTVVISPLKIAQNKLSNGATIKVPTVLISPLKTAANKPSNGKTNKAPTVLISPFKTGKDKPTKVSPLKVPSVSISPLKTPKACFNDSLLAKRPKRICRLPSKFEDHSISPSKFMPVQPAFASTPKVLKTVDQKSKDKKVSSKKIPVTNKVVSTKVNQKRVVQRKDKDSSKDSSADTNNNAKKDLPHKENITKKSAVITKTTSPKISPRTKSTTNKKQVNKKLAEKNSSFRVLEDKKSLKRDASNLDVYEFTYDPNEEPPPQKKKRKKPAKKREPKPKNVVFKNNYNVNVAKAMLALKNKVATKTSPIEKVASGNMSVTPATTGLITHNNPANKIVTQTTTSNPIVVKEKTVCNIETSHVSQKNYNSVRVEDIALDFEDSFVDDINYSPVNSPCRPVTPAPENVDKEHTERPVHNADPLNLRDDLSFFDDRPVANSSMNVSVRHPEASPWRAEFSSLPIKWQVNTYVKPNMTPAFESSFINFSDSKKKHVYTNMGPDVNEENVPQIFEDNTSKLKQTSIISYIKECVQRSAKKRKDKLTPVKANSLFEDLNNTSVYTDAQKQVTPKKTQNKMVSDEKVSPNNQNVSVDTSNECSTDNSKGDNDNSSEKVKSTSKKKKDKNVTYFGFDDSENQDQENVSPTKKIDKRELRALKPRSRAVLQEINRMKEPTRAVLPAAIKSKPIQSSDSVIKVFDQMKSAAEPPVFPEKEPVQTSETTNITEVQLNENPANDDDDDQSVHLFEDIEVVHHLKAHRKSYGKAKKGVTFRQNSVSDSDIPASEVADQSCSSDEDDLHDLTFKVPAEEPKKTKRKKKTKKLSKKEEQEVEAWAAGFNSMCEDIEEFDLVVE